LLSTATRYRWGGGGGGGWWGGVYLLGRRWFVVGGGGGGGGKVGDGVSIEETHLPTISHACAIFCNIRHGH